MKHQLFIEAAMRSKLYQNKLKNINLEDWNSIPFTTKEDLRKADTYDVLGVPLHQVATYHETSGTTGTPTPSWYSHKDHEHGAQVVLRSALKLNDQDIVLNRFPFALAIPSFIVYDACQNAGAVHIGVDKASMVTPDRRVIEIIQRTHPTVLTMLPSEAEKLYHVGMQMGVHFPTQGLRALLLAGELVSPARKKYIENMWGVPVHMLFGSTETGGLFMTCENGHYHLDNTNVLIEVVDDSGIPVEIGKTGNCVISSSREGMPLLRYFNQDIIQLMDGAHCDCKKTEPIMIHYGRKEDVIEYQNKSVNFYELQEAVYTLSRVPFMWKMKTSRNRVQFLCQFIEPIGEAILSAIQHELCEKLGFEVDIQLTEIIPLKKLTDKPAYGKYAYIERECADEHELLIK
ncbi:phenylacetate--CoA ligase family protein [Bacillus smithii]|jgi:phenylacetate-CoA ligase|uniref:phenylacetate--CoA ligase family protein n=1 Tax=Bacillus smithii TaxID=1479 RepID=UPI002E24006B|nr:AMP-binding protein [Bacillus smithii]MED1457469.1 AMP-binding protein [Bacillus smithii]